MNALPKNKHNTHKVIKNKVQSIDQKNPDASTQSKPNQEKTPFINFDPSQAQKRVTDYLVDCDMFLIILRMARDGEQESKFLPTWMIL